MLALVDGATRLGVRLDPVQVDQFRRYYRELKDWNRRVNLTAVTTWEEVRYRHFLDSLSVVAAIGPQLLEDGKQVLDVGSGAGFPGLPLRIAYTGLRLSLLEATAKKAAFLEHLVECLGLDRVRVLRGRAETLAHDPSLRESFDLVLSRGVARLPTLAELCLPFCRTGGTVAAHKSQPVAEEVRGSLRAVAELGGRLTGVSDVSYQGSGGGRALVVLQKIGPTPSRYPRRPGMPAKRSL